MSYNAYDYPGMLTDGILWFKDLSSPDPYGILPIVGGIMNLVNMMTSSNTGGHPAMRKFMKLMRILPIMMIPIYMTFPVAFNIYWIIFASVNLMLTNCFRVERFRKFIGLPNYLAGTKLEKQYGK
jgi:YidC/Oxa1 family membrane protein insertase